MHTCLACRGHLEDHISPAKCYLCVCGGGRDSGRAGVSCEDPPRLGVARREQGGNSEGNFHTLQELALPWELQA